MNYMTEEIVKFIITTEDQKDLDLIRKALQLRNKVLSDIRALVAEHDIYVGDEVKIINISTKYINNKTGRVEDIRDGAYRIWVFDVPDGKDHVHLIPASCVVKV